MNRIRRRPAGVADDTTDAMRADACIRFVSNLDTEAAKSYPRGVSSSASNRESPDGRLHRGLVE